MTLSASQLEYYIADRMRIKSKEAREKNKEKEMFKILAKIEKAAEEGEFSIITHIKFSENVNVIQNLEYTIQSSGNYCYQITWEKE